ncbi:anti-repressor protein [Pseudomonas flexibilis]|uniref:Anti-repressor protein n=1 Tax=Pseudomonas flexibilis TaxID=706570 RepID=A0A1N6UGE2_9PSED|nr:anti-repressor protein [Pseudomonas flexibilis]
MNTTTRLIPVFNGELDGRQQQLCDARDLHQ